MKRQQEVSTTEGKSRIQQARRANNAKHQANLSDAYINHLLGSKNAPEKLVRLKREQILNARAIALLEAAALQSKDCNDEASGFAVATTSDLRRSVLDLIGGLPDGEFEEGLARELYTAVRNLGEAINFAVYSIKG
jgi:hypothetical protein